MLVTSPAQRKVSVRRYRRSPMPVLAVLATACVAEEATTGPDVQATPEPVAEQPEAAPSEPDAAPTTTAAAPELSRKEQHG